METPSFPCPREGPLVSMLERAMESPMDLAFPIMTFSKVWYYKTCFSSIPQRNMLGWVG